jgi:hypothetical protein
MFLTESAGAYGARHPVGLIQVNRLDAAPTPLDR